MKILMTGATGFVGQQLGKALVELGHQLIVVSRDQEKAKLNLPFPCLVIEADLSQQLIPPEKLQGIDAVFHLAGENIGEARWTVNQKNKIIHSRVQTTKNLLQSFRQIESARTFIMSSAIGFYGDRQDEVLDEKSTQGQGFLSEVCEQWEAAFQQGIQNLQNQDRRTVILRTSVVLSPFGGALDKMKQPFLFGVGSALGHGKQWMSWIHIQDLIRVFIQALQDSKLKGVINAVSPEPVTNLEFSQTLAKLLKTRLLPSVPQIILRTLLGEMANLIFDSQKVKTLFLNREQFLFPDLQSALQDCLQYHKENDFYFFAEQYIPYKKEKVFTFFSLAENLEKITPSSLQFRIVKKSTQEIQEGTLIDYKLRIHGFPVGWQTQILNWNPNDSFVDTQLKGPYQKWHHTHSFVSLHDGTLMTDLVRYRLPFGRLGYLLAGVFVRRDIQKIFAFRRQSVLDSVLYPP